MRNNINEKFFTAKNDRVFKILMFNDKNVKILKSFLETILKVKIDNINYLHTDENKGNIHLKQNNLDVLVDTNAGRIGIEMNAIDKAFIHTRNVAYIADEYSHYFKVGDNYDESTKFLQINLTYGMKGRRKDKKEVRHYKIQDEEGVKFVDNFEIIEYNMDEYEDMWKKNNIALIKDNWQFIMLNREEKELEKLTHIERKVDDFMEEIKKINQDPNYRQYISEEEDKRKIHNSELNEAKNEGIKQGIEQGIEQKAIETAKNMLRKKINIETIMEITGLSKEKIEKLR
jgi:predicted transposase/invertase (TIGR01784 family)